MRKSLIILFSVIALSCEKYSAGLNVDPNNFTDAPGESIIGQANLTWVLISEGEAARMSGIFSDQFTGFSNQFVNFEVYDVKSADFNGIWNSNYSGGIAQTRIVQEKATALGNARLLGVAQIVEAVMAAELASLFGDVPFSQSAQPVAFPNPKFDTQLEVLAAAQILLSKGIENVGDARVADFYGSPVFVSNAALWSEVAHSLKARYYMITKEYTKARSEAKLGISTVDRSLMSFHSTVAGQGNLFYQFGIEQRGGYLTATRSYLRKMLNLSDNTVGRVLFTPGDEVRFKHYFQGNELNYGVTGYFGQANSFPIVDWYENQFILAEAELRLGNEVAARTAFNAVRAALAKKYNASFPEVQIGGNTLLKVILEEKYVTMIGSPQVYNDLRRTNNLLNVPIKSSLAKTIPQRFLYPEVEINTNKSFPGVIGLFVPTTVNK
jgi:starch-binding outer membrane protein, SusD/RagB family